MNQTYAYFRIKLHDLTAEQKLRIEDLSRVRRFVYNWGLNYCNEQYELGKSCPGFVSLSRAFQELRMTPGYGWLLDYNITTCRYALKDLLNGFAKFFGKINRYPRFKSKKRDKVTFATRGDRLRFYGEHGEYVRIPGVSKSAEDVIYCGRHNVPFGKHVSYDNVRVKFDGVDYWLSLSIKVYRPFEIDSDYFPRQGQPLGIDVGVRTSATLSDGTMYDRPDQWRLGVLRNRRDKLRSAIGRDISRRYKESTRTKTKYEDIPKSKNQLKRERRWRKTCSQITNIYKNHYHRIAKGIVDKEPAFVVVETLGLQFIEQNSYINVKRQIHEAGLSTLIRYIDYKCTQNDIRVVYAPRDYKSSQRCSICGKEHKIGPSKIYECSCGNIMDRDLNAARNLLQYGMSHLYGPNTDCGIR